MSGIEPESLIISGLTTFGIGGYYNHKKRTSENARPSF